MGLETKKKPTIKEVFNKLRRGYKHLPAIFWDTAKDMRKPREIGLVLAGAILPGGFILYGLYRAEIYRRKKLAASNDNAPQADITPAPVTRKKPDAKAPGF